MMLKEISAHQSRKIKSAMELMKFLDKDCGNCGDKNLVYNFLYRNKKK